MTDPDLRVVLEEMITAGGGTPGEDSLALLDQQLDGYLEVQLGRALSKLPPAARAEYLSAVDGDSVLRKHLPDYDAWLRGLMTDFRRQVIRRLNH